MAGAVIRRPLFRVAALAYLVIGLAAFAPILTAGFVSDDWDFLIIVARAHSALVCFEPLVGRFVRPLVVLTYYLNYQLFGLWSLPYHLTVVLLHVGNASLVCLLAERIDPEHRPVVAFTAGLLFLVFGGHSEPVSWVAGVADPLQALPLIGALLCLWPAIDSDRPLRFYLLGWLLAAVSLLAKETAAVFPALVVTFAFLQALRAADRRRVLLRSLIFVTVPIVLTVSLFVVRRAVFGAAVGAYSGLGTSNGHILKETAAFVIRSFMPPVPLAAKEWLMQINPIAALIVAVVIAAAAFARCRARTTLALTFAAVVLSLLPVLPLTISLTESQSERFVYVPSAFASIFVVLLIDGVFVVRSLVTTLVATAMVANILALERSNRAWREGGILFDDILRSSVRLIRQHDPSRSAPVVVLNLPDTLRGTYVLRNGFVPGLRLIAPDVDWTPLRLVTTASQASVDAHATATVIQRAPLEFLVSLHGSALYPQPPVEHSWFRFPEWSPNGYTIRFVPVDAPLLILHVSDGRMNLTASLSGLR